MSKVRYKQYRYESFKDTKTGDIRYDFIDVMNEQDNKIQELEKQLQKKDKRIKELKKSLKLACEAVFDEILPYQEIQEMKTKHNKYSYGVILEDVIFYYDTLTKEK